MKKPCKVIAYITDFGYEDPYVAAMKGVALSICRDIEIVDITHSIPSFDVKRAAFELLVVYKYFPSGTIFVVVVDPGVGSARKPLLIISKNYFFVGPDNGVLMPAAKSDGIEQIIVLTNDRYFRKPVSASFHGRDIFTPVAAWLACGVEPESFGEVINVEQVTDLDMGISAKPCGSCIKLKVLHIDKFGNVILSHYFNEVSKILGLEYDQTVTVHINDRSFDAIVKKVFSQAAPGTLVLYEDSFGFAELAVNLGSARDLLGVREGDEIAICRK